MNARTVNSIRLISICIAGSAIAAAYGLTIDKITWQILHAREASGMVNIETLSKQLKGVTALYYALLIITPALALNLFNKSKQTPSFLQIAGVITAYFICISISGNITGAHKVSSGWDNAVNLAVCIFAALNVMINKDKLNVRSS